MQCLHLLTEVFDDTKQYCDIHALSPLGWRGMADSHQPTSTLRPRDRDRNRTYESESAASMCPPPSAQQGRSISPLTTSPL